MKIFSRVPFFMMCGFVVKGFNFQVKNLAPLTVQLPRVSLQSATIPILGSLLSIFLSVNAAGAATEVKTYTNERYHTVLSYPADFVTQTGQLSGERDVIAFTDPNDPDTSASLVFSPVPAGIASSTALCLSSVSIKEIRTLMPLDAHNIFPNHLPVQRVVSDF